MIYLKSLLAGVAALVAFYFLFVTIGLRLLVPRPPDLPKNTGYISNSPWFPLWLFPVIALVIFAATTYLTFRTLSRTR